MQLFLLKTCALLSLFFFAFQVQASTDAKSVDVCNPYAGVDWDEVHYLHSFSHQHGRPSSTPSDLGWHSHGTDDRLIQLYRQGFRHFALSNYRPAIPVYPFYPLPDELEQKDDLISSPNAEHRTPSDFTMHFNTIGSYYRSGVERHWQVDSDETPYVHAFDGIDLTVYHPRRERSSDGVYSIQVLLSSRGGKAGGDPEVYVSIPGALPRTRRSAVEPSSAEEISNYRMRHRDEVFLVFTAADPELRIDYDPATTRIDRIILNARLHVPFRQGFAEALDGTRVNAEGEPVEGLQFPDGGGITINHPSRADYREYLPVLDSDERVLGIEIWNQHFQFGRESSAPYDRYYRHWDDFLRTGRRVFGFAVKDHRWQGRGRNVLLVPDPADRTREERKRDALRAYRQGAFFAVVGAIETDEDGVPTERVDYTEFRFVDLSLEYDEHGQPLAVKASTAGNDSSRRPNVQLRFITDQGMEEVVNQSEGWFELPRTAEGEVDRMYVRVEAMAFPSTHQQGRPLTAEMMAAMNIYDIAHLHDHRGVAGGWRDYPSGQDPIGIVDMVFSQPVRFIQSGTD